MEETGALAGKVAVVTGAARNIGREIALALGGEGAAVLVNALSDGQAAETVAGEVTAAGGRGLAHLLDPVHRPQAALAPERLARTPISLAGA